MSKKSPSPKGSRKSGTSPNTLAGRSGRRQGTPRIMILAVVVVIVGGALLFWPKSGPVPSGIGERQSVVTAPDSNQSVPSLDQTAAPRSGDVDLETARETLTPEEPENQSSAATIPQAKPKPKPKAKPKAKPAKPAAQPVEPLSSGSWAVQTGGFGKAANADQEAARLAAAGWNSMVRAGSNSQGTMVYRVWIGYFPTRDQANLFIRQHKKTLADAFAVHR